MTGLLLLALVTAVVSAVRSTWSPCGESVLSTITPVSEPGRGNRWGVTAGAFVVGALVAGAAVGAVSALATPLTGRLEPTAAWWIAALAGAGAVVLDRRNGGRGLPPRRRQLNEDDSRALRGWIYGGWWGLQVGSGMATISMTAGVYLTFLLGALTGRPVLAVAVGATFGLTRGLGVLPAGRLTDPAALRAFHRRMDDLDVPARRATFTWLAAATGLAVATAAGGGPAVGVGLAALAGAVAVPVSAGAPRGRRRLRVPIEAAAS
ncbi:MAG: hypothetical protein AB7L84_10345 [Acidimicrobiia bacterium]